MESKNSLKRKNTINIVIFIILAILTVIIVKNNRRSTTDLNINAFQIRDTAKIYKVFIADMKNHSVILTRTANGWKVNEKYDAHPVRITSMLEVLAKMEIKSPVPESAKNNVIKDMAANSVKVELYHKNKKKPFHVFYVGNPTSDNLGTYMSLAKGNRTPQIVHIPGWYGYLSDGYFFCEEDEWRTKNIFPAKSAIIDEVKLIDNIKPDSSFILKVNGLNNFSISHPRTGISFGKVVPEIAKSFLYALSELTFTVIDKTINQEKKDSILNSKPIIYIEIKTTNKQIYWLKLFYKPTDKTTRAELFPGVDKEYFYGISNSRKNEIMLVQHLRLSEILLKPNDFLLKK